MEIKNCTLSDTDEILLLYEAARSLQRGRKMVVWPEFDARFVEREIAENRQWKIVTNNTIVCNWVITFEDKEIWEERDNGNSIYIHRICKHPDYSGHRYINTIVDWAKEYAKQAAKQYIRLDTLGNNTKLIQHYISAGFAFLGIHRLIDTSTLPQHYQNEPNCCLFEIDLKFSN